MSKLSQFNPTTYVEQGNKKGSFALFQAEFALYTAEVAQNYIRALQWPACAAEEEMCLLVPSLWYQQLRAHHYQQSALEHNSGTYFYVSMTTCIYFSFFFFFFLAKSTPYKAGGKLKFVPSESKSVSIQNQKGSSAVKRSFSSFSFLFFRKGLIVNNWKRGKKSPQVVYCHFLLHRG